ncbi:peptidoglycan recognition protein family protein [Aequorivita echinoideorum]|uniref:N-acetylmuramoyl-L-alanine amidase n=1 Tax=Aequorivita echinoideorum TaxID=1549647 RepID=A0ABS5S5F9_9FLAO|nr:N-acetylmuramoyl-L-alanine amidase [Aequorivita echinoideorum]MBT0607649.1 N-acetylmuramoyl-L-alanine amidase [Aequorivita echinoideorum]
MRKVRNIVIHCTAGHSNAEAVQSYFTRPKSKGGRGWKKGGYHRIIEKDGTIKKMYDFSEITNGVAGHNSDTIHISYVGGVEILDVNTAKDTRTPYQKNALHTCIHEAIKWCKENGQDITKDLGVVGHRDFSKDGNANGVIESWERIKSCPSFDVLPEYSMLYASPDRYNKLPYNK